MLSHPLIKLDAKKKTNKNILNLATKYIINSKNLKIFGKMLRYLMEFEDYKLSLK